MADLSTLLGLIQNAITLERALHWAIDSYCNAHETSQSLKVFGLNLNADRLYYIQTLLSQQTERDVLRSSAGQNLREAVDALNKELRDSTAYFQDREPNRTIPRVWWALHAESKVRKLQENLQKRLDDIAGFLQLVRTTSQDVQQPLKPLEQPKFKIHPRTSQRKVLTGLKWSKAHYYPEDAKQVKNYNPSVKVLIERLPKDAEQIVRHLREISEARPNARYYTGLLPCIGYTPGSTEQQDLVSLLPRNAAVTAQSPSSLQRAIVHSRKADSSITITLETRFNMALQLARALLAIHTAGFSNCSIRSDKILFVQPLQDEEPAKEVNNAAPGDPSPPPAEPGQEKGSAIQQMRNKLRRTSTRAGRSGVENQSGTKEDKEKGNREPRRRTSLTSIRESIRGRREKRSEKNVPATSADPSASPETSSSKWPENSVLEMGSIPPGGSVFLAYWQSMKVHTAGPVGWNREWHKDLYRHPSLQTQEWIDFSTGHDIYALGVCLLEIGLWDALVWEDSGGFHVSKVLARKLETRSDKRPRVLENLTKKTEGAEALEVLMKKPGGPEKVRQTLIDIATSELPKLMGKGYTTVVQACLECMDGEKDKYWNIDLGKLEFGRGEKDYRRRVCEAIDTILISMLSQLSTSISGEEF